MNFFPLKTCRFVSSSLLFRRTAKDVVTNLLRSKKTGHIDVEPEKLLRIPRGTRDFHPNQMKIREDVIRLITDCFKQHGANSIDTPAMELTSLLKGKYGEDSKLIYELKENDDGESLALRYDLTVPFARYIVQNKISAIKLFHIGKVYRLDQPKMNRGRYREFYQCDFDIAGEYESMLQEAECLKIINDILDRLSLGKYKIYVNHRKLLDAIFTVCGVPKELFRLIGSSVDKLDKTSWENVQSELINEKGLSREVTDRFWTYFQLNGNSELIAQLRNNSQLSSQPAAIEALEDLELLFHYLKLYKVDEKVVFDLKLSRGLDYYTGVIFEAVLTEYEYDPRLNQDQIAVGSVAAGGRYDKLVEKIDPKERRVPCIGLSVGVERIFAIKEHQQLISQRPLKTIETEIFVASAEKNFLEERMKLLNELWQNGFKAEMAFKRDPKLLDQLQYCEKNLVQLCLIIGSDELKNQTVKIRHVRSRNEIEIPRDQLIDQLRKHLKGE